MFSEVIGICDKGNSCNFIFVQQYLSNETSSAKKKDIHTINEIIILLGKVRPSLELSLSGNLAWIITLSMKKKNSVTINQNLVSTILSSHLISQEHLMRHCGCLTIKN